MFKKEMKVLFAVSEADPFAKAGGLGDVGGTLPKILNNLNCAVRVIMPRYASIPLPLQKEIRFLTEFKVDLSWRRQDCVLSEMTHEGVEYFFIENDYYFSRDNIYGYEDDGERFAFFSKAVLESLLHLRGFKPDIIHCHDWHTALIPVMMKEYYAQHPFYFGMKSCFTIHNLQHQGVFPKFVLGDLLGMDENSPGGQSLMFFDERVNFLKGGLLKSDVITTVSPTYAQEILDPYYGEGLDGVLRQRKDDLVGILNGIDYEKYDPRTDPVLVAHYPTPNWKRENKKHLQGLFQLPVNSEIPLLSVVSRLVDQKGFDLLCHVFDEILSMELQLVILGTGEERYENKFVEYSKRYPEKFGVKIMYDEELCHKIYGGADLILMPSRFEPCGLAQMMAMRYGTVPVVRETGGLKDSVLPYDQENHSGNGFLFTSYNAHDFLAAVERAVNLFYKEGKEWQSLTERAMEEDFSWEKSGRKYIKLYEDILR